MSGDSVLARRLWLEALDRRAEMDMDSALVLLRAARDADQRFLPAHLDYISYMESYGERQRAQAEYQALASGGDPFFACLTLVGGEFWNEPMVEALLAKLDARHGPTSCSAELRFRLAANRIWVEKREIARFEEYWRRALRYAPDYPGIWVHRYRGLRWAGRSDAARTAGREGIRRSQHPIPRLHFYLGLAAVEREAGDLTRSEEIRSAAEAAALRDGRPGLEWEYFQGLDASLFSGPGGLQRRDSVVFRSLRLALRHGHWTYRLYALWAVANNLLDYHGQPSAAIPYLDHLVALADSVARPWHQLRAYRLRGRTYSKMGRLGEAERDLLRAVAAGRSAGDSYQLGEAYHNLAHVSEAAGRLIEASRMADQWIATVDGMRSSAARVMAYRDAGMIRWKAGWHAAATGAFEEMVRAIDEQRREYYWAGEYFEREGDLRRALAYYRLERENGLALAGLARIYDALGFPDSAEGAAREHDRRLVDLLAVPIAPRLLARQGRTEEALALARAWAERRLAQDNLQGATLSLLELAELLAEHGRPREALTEADTAKRLAEQYSFTDELIRARRIAGVARIGMGDRVGGLDALRAAAALARSHPTEDAVRVTHVALADALAAAGRVEEAFDAYDRAARVVEKVVGHLDEDLDRARYRARQLAPFDGALRLLLRQPDSAKRTRDLIHWSQRRKAAALALAAPSGAGSTGGIAATLSPGAIQQRLATGEALIDYLLLDGRTAAIVLTRDRISVKPLSVPRDSLRWWIDELTWPLRAKAGGRVDLARLTFDVPSASRLYDAIISPLEPLLTGTTRLTIIPDGVLHYLPFEALLLPASASAPPGAQRSGTYLLDRYEIAYRPSSRFLGSLSLGEWNGLSASDRVMVLNYAVPGEEAEVEAITGAWKRGRVTILTGHAATETAATHAAASYPVLHFAVHAVVDGQDPLRSHLRLARDERNDGYLHLNEISSRWISAKLVILSGCETLAGVLYDGEGLMGLARAFATAGARDVVATRWPVGAPAADLFGFFYQGLATGEQPVVALRHARIAVRENPATAHPFFWAGFVLLSTR